MSRFGIWLLTGYYIPKTLEGWISLSLPVIFAGLIFLFPKFATISLILFIVTSILYIRYLIKQI